MATQPFHALPPSPTFPGPGVAASIQRAITAAGETGDRLADTARVEVLRKLDGAGRTIDRRFPARRLHVVRPEASHHAHAFRPSAPA